MVTPIDNPFSSSSGAASGDASRSSIAGANITDPLERSAREAAEGLKSVSRRASRSMQERMDALNEFGNRSLATSRTYVREHPLQSTAMALAAGMLLRRMMSRRRFRY
jgi:ElaB/YqjD/DUF883 family membrane-anchored ribosome-binding protein